MINSCKIWNLFNCKLEGRIYISISQSWYLASQMLNIFLKVLGKIKLFCTKYNTDIYVFFGGGLPLISPIDGIFNVIES